MVLVVDWGLVVEVVLCGGWSWSFFVRGFNDDVEVFFVLVRDGVWGWVWSLVSVFLVSEEVRRFGCLRVIGD